MKSRGSIAFIVGTLLLGCCIGGFRASAQTGDAGGAATKGDGENKVVVVDPTKMRIIDVIGPPGAH